MSRRPASQTQLLRISQRVTALGYTEPDGLKLVAQIVGRPIVHGDDLSTAEATQLLNVLYMEYESEPK